MCCLGGLKVLMLLRLIQNPRTPFNLLTFPFFHLALCTIPKVKQISGCKYKSYTMTAKTTRHDIRRVAVQSITRDSTGRWKRSSRTGHIARKIRLARASASCKCTNTVEDLRPDLGDSLGCSPSHSMVARELRIPTWSIPKYWTTASRDANRVLDVREESRRVLHCYDAGESGVVLCSEPYNIALISCDHRFSGPAF